jgi:superfamily II RNA helicase
MLMFLKERELLPSINFMFSKKMINSTADRLRHLDFCTNEEKGRIGAFIARCATRHTLYGNQGLSLILRCTLGALMPPLSPFLLSNSVDFL